MNVSATDRTGLNIDLGERLERLFDALHSQGVVVSLHQRVLASRVMFGACESGLASVPVARIRGRIGSILANSEDEQRLFSKLFDLHFEVTDATQPIDFSGRKRSPFKPVPDDRVVELPMVPENKTGFWLWGVMGTAAALIMIFVVLNLPDPDQGRTVSIPEDVVVEVGPGVATKPDQRRQAVDVTKLETDEILRTASRISAVLEADRPLTLSDISLRLYPPAQNTGDAKRWVRFLRVAVRRFSRAHNDPMYFHVRPSDDPSPAQGQSDGSNFDAGSRNSSVGFPANFAVLTATVLEFEGRLNRHMDVPEIAGVLTAASYRSQAPDTASSSTTGSDRPSTLVASGWLAALLVLFPLLAGCYWLGKRKDRARDYLRRRIPEIPPVMRNITIAAGDFSKTLRDSVHDAAIQMSRRSALATTNVDADKTVSATIAHGGWLVPRYKEVLRRPEYLVVICIEGDDDQNARRLDRLVEVLKREDILITRYFMDANANTFYRSHADAGKTLSQLWFDYPDHRMILVGTGNVFLRPGRHTPWPWARDVQRWECRALLTPVDPAKWRKKEAALSELFGSPLQPATLTGFAAAARYMNSSVERGSTASQSELSGTVLSWEDRPERWLSPADLEDAEWKLLLGDLEAYFGGDHAPALEWLCSCAIYPALNWDIALYLGLKLNGPDGKAYYTEARAGKLTNLPWFTAGFIPDPLRQRMLQYLKDHSQARHRAAVLAVTDLLKGVTTGDVARDDETITLRVGQEPLSQRHAQQMQRRQNRDVVLIDRLADEDVTDLVVEVGQNWREKFEHVRDRYIVGEFARLSAFIAYSAVVAVLVPWPIDGPLALNPWTPIILFLSASVLCWFYYRNINIVTVRRHE